MTDPNDLSRAKELLHSDPSLTCVFVRGEWTFFGRARGVNPLLEWVGKAPAGFSAADRVVGRAAALLYALLGAERVYAEVMSTSAEEVFLAHAIGYEAQQKTPAIINRRGDGRCPMEEATDGITDPEEGYRAILKRLSELKQEKM